MTSFEDALADAIRAAKAPAGEATARREATAVERAAAIASRREAIASFLRRMESAGSPGLTTVMLLRRPPAARTPTHRRFRKHRHVDDEHYEPESAYLVAHCTHVPIGVGPVAVLRPFWVTIDGAAIWATGTGDVHEVDLREIVPLHENLAPSLAEAWAVAAADRR